MPATRFILPGLLFILSACDPKQRPSQAPAPAPAPLPSPAKPQTPPQAPPGLQVRLERAGAGAQVRIQNRGDADLSLAAALTLSRVAQGAEQAKGGQRLSTRADCESSPPACVTLAPGAELLPALLHLRAGDMQCGAATSTLAAGSYRVSARGCGDPPYEKVSAALPLP